MITRKRVKSLNKILTCLLCKGYLIEATTINTCMHSFCRSCIVKHVKIFEKYFCPNCKAEIRLSNLRPDMRLRSVVYKLIPGLYAKEQQNASETNGRQKAYLNGSAHLLIGKHERQQLGGEACSEDESLSKQYFYDQDEPISLSLEYHMESIFGNTIALNNIPQIRYLQAPAAFKVAHLKKFLSLKYDLNNLKKSMNIDIIYDGDILLDDFSLMDIAYAYSWEREAPLKLFYRIYKGSKHNSNKFKLIERALNRQPYVKLSTELKDAEEARKALSMNSCDTTTDASKKKSYEAPRHDLKIIIAKKSSSKSIRNIGVGNNKIKLNKPNGNGSSKVLSDFERLRGDVDNVQFSSASSSEIVSEMKTTLSKKSGTVSHHDLKLENKSNTKKHNSVSHDYYESATMNEREKEKSCYSEKSGEKSRRESTKHAKNNEKIERFKAKSKSNLSLNNIPKLKIELPSLKTKITVPKTPSDTYVISSKSPSSTSSPKCESPLKKVRFDISSRSCYDFNDDADMGFVVDQMEYAERIGLKPVERKVESIILHRKRKKSKHSKETEHSKRPKLHVSSSLDESLKLKLKIMGGKASCKSDKKSNEEEAHHEKATCNLRAVQGKTADLTSINVQEEKQKNIRERQKEADDAVVVGMENHKYSVTEQRNVKSGSDQPMVFIPKLVLQKTQSASSSSDKKESLFSFNAAQQRRNSFVVEQSKPMSSDANESIKLKVRSFDSIASSDFANQKLMKPPTAKMGSPKQSQMSTTFSLSPMRPHSIPASLKLSPISQTVKSDYQMQSQNLMKRSLSLGAEKSSPSYLNAFIQPNKNLFPSTTLPDAINIQYSKVPPLISTSTSSMRNFYGSMTNTTNNKSQSPQHASKLPNINVKDPIKLFPNACPSVEILKIPQKTFSPVATTNIKLNRPLMPTTIPLERIRKSAQNPVAQKILPKPQMNQNVMKATGFHQSPQCSSQTLNYSGIYQTPNNRDVSLERYTLELTHDIAKLDRSLSLEKNFEDWEKRKLQEYSKMNELKSFPLPTKNLLNQQQNLSVRNIPNPSAIMMSRNQTLSNSSVAIKASNMSPHKESVTSTNSEQSDIEEILSKSTIAKAASEKQLSDFPSQKSPVSKVNDKKSIEKLTEYLRLTAAKSKDAKHDDDNNNNNSTNNCDESTANKNNRNFNLLENKSEKFINVSIPSVDVICIDS